MNKKVLLTIAITVILAITLPFVALAEGIVKTVGMGSDANFGGIFNSISGKNRFISVYLDTDVCPGKKDITNMQANDDALGKSVKANIILDGKNITDWIKAGSGNLYAVMVHYIYMATPDTSGFKGQIAIWVNPADETGPTLERDEFHTLEILGGLLTPAGKNIEAVKYLYKPSSKSWTKVANFDDISVGGSSTVSSKAIVTSSEPVSSATSVEKDISSKTSDISSKASDISSKASDISSQASDISSQASSSDEAATEKSEFPLWAVILITVLGTCAVLTGGYFVYNKIKAPK